VFYEASAFLATFVLLGHWFEMRARGGANDAMRALLDLAPPRAVVIRDGRKSSFRQPRSSSGISFSSGPVRRCPSTPRSSTESQP